MPRDVRDPASRLSDLVAEVEPSLKRKFLEAMFLAKSKLTLEVLVAYLEVGRLDEALLVVDRVIAGFAESVHAALVRSGKATAEQVISRAVDVSFHFDVTDLRLVTAARQAKLDMVREFTDEQRRASHAAIVDGVQRGLNPRAIAREVREGLGLTLRQQQAVQNYRNLLESGSREALGRKLRDRRFDPTVTSAIDDGRVLEKAQVDRMVERYRERYLIYRSEVIARTEALRAVHVGNDEAYEQAFDAGDLAREQVVREWNTAKDERVRSSHRAMHGQLRKVGEAFLSGDGNHLMRPGDATAPAADVCQCRCSTGTRIRLVLLPNESIDVQLYQQAAAG